MSRNLNVFRNVKINKQPSADLVGLPAVDLKTSLLAENLAYGVVPHPLFLRYFMSKTQRNPSRTNKSVDALKQNMFPSNNGSTKVDTKEQEKTSTVNLDKSEVPEAAKPSGSSGFLGTALGGLVKTATDTAIGIAENSAKAAVNTVVEKVADYTGSKDANDESPVDDVISSDDSEPNEATDYPLVDEIVDEDVSETDYDDESEQRKGDHAVSRDDVNVNPDLTSVAPPVAPGGYTLNHSPDSVTPMLLQESGFGLRSDSLASSYRSYIDNTDYTVLGEIDITPSSIPVPTVAAEVRAKVDVEKTVVKPTAPDPAPVDVTSSYARDEIDAFTSDMLLQRRDADCVLDQIEYIMNRYSLGWEEASALTHQLIINRFNPAVIRLVAAVSSFNTRGTLLVGAPRARRGV